MLTSFYSKNNLCARNYCNVGVMYHETYFFFSSALYIYGQLVANKFSNRHIEDKNLKNDYVKNNIIIIIILLFILK